MIDKKNKIIQENLQINISNKEEIEKNYNFNNCYIDVKEFSKDLLDILNQLKLEKTSEIIKEFIDKKNEKIVSCDNLEEYIIKALIDLINFDKDKKYIPKTISKDEFEDDFIKIISYKSKSIVNMHILKIKDEYLIIDCGAEIISKDIRKIDIENFLEENNIEKDKIKNLILTHAHLDHYGSIDLIDKYVDNIYMTKDTLKIIKAVDKKIYIDNSKIKIKKNDEKFKINNLEIEFFPSNHIKGSVGVLISYLDKKILHTGDFSFNQQVTTTNLSRNFFEKFKNIDYLIMECTYGYKEVEIPYRHKKSLLSYFANLSVKNNIKVVIPSFAIGKAQECFNIIKKDINNKNIIVDGLASKVNKCYYDEENLIYEKRKSILDKYFENDIIIATGGVISKGSCAHDYYKLALKDSKMVTFIKNGYIDKDTINEKLKIYDSIKINVLDISLPFHADYEDLIGLIETVKPKNLILVHGEGIKGYI